MPWQEHTIQIRNGLRDLQAMSASAKISANDVTRAEQEVQACKRAWERYGCQEVTDKELEETGRHVVQGAEELRRLEALGDRWVRFRIGLLWVLERSGVAGWGWLTGSLIVGTAAVVVAAVPLVLAFQKLPVALGRCACCFLIAGLPTDAILAPLSGRDAGEEMERLRGASTSEVGLSPVRCRR
jgi:hypothetical protein